MNLVNSKDVVADRVRDIQAQAAMAGRARQVRGADRAGGARRGLAALAGVPGLAALAGVPGLARPQSIMKAVEEL